MWYAFDLMWYVEVEAEDKEWSRENIVIEVMESWRYLFLNELTVVVFDSFISCLLRIQCCIFWVGYRSSVVDDSVILMSVKDVLCWWRDGKDFWQFWSCWNIRSVRTWDNYRRRKKPFLMFQCLDVWGILLYACGMNWKYFAQCFVFFLVT